MSFGDLFSKRLKRAARQGQPDVFTYDKIPQELRVQAGYILRDVFGTLGSYNERANQVWSGLRNTLVREYGVLRLIPPKDLLHDNAASEVLTYLLQCSTQQALDVIELGLRIAEQVVARWPYNELLQEGRRILPAEAIAEMNFRFLEHGVGYEYIDGSLIRKDRQFVHDAVIKPALALLHEAKFTGANDEFLKAHALYREGNNKQAIAEALKAFESTMKAICKERRWSPPENATAAPLIDFLVAKELIPLEMKGHFTSLQAAMKQGLPTLSNRTSRHGQGPEPVEVPRHFVAYALHLCAANIVFLVEAHKARQ
jgi:hypothetical protein